MPFIDDIEFYQQPGGDSGSINFDGTMEQTEVFIVKWADRLRFAALVLGYPLNSDGTPNFTGVARAPMYHNIDRRLKALHCSFKGVGHIDPTDNTKYITDNRGFLIYVKCWVTVKFGIPPFIVPGEANEEPFIEESADLAGQFEPVSPDHPYKWQNDNVPIRGSIVARQTMYVDHVFTFYRVRNFNTNILEPYQGKINASPFRGKAAETLLFEGASTKQITTTLSTQPVTLSLRFKKRAISWNKLHRPGKTPEYQYTSPPLYEMANFNALVSALRT